MEEICTIQSWGEDSVILNKKTTHTIAGLFTGFRCSHESGTFCPVLWLFAMCLIFPTHKLPEGREHISMVCLCCMRFPGIIALPNCLLCLELLPLTSHVKHSFSLLHNHLQLLFYETLDSLSNRGTQYTMPLFHLVYTPIIHISHVIHGYNFPTVF